MKAQTRISVCTAPFWSDFQNWSDFGPRLNFYLFTYQFNLSMNASMNVAQDLTTNMANAANADSKIDSRAVSCEVEPPDLPPHEPKLQIELDAQNKSIISHACTDCNKWSKKSSKIMVTDCSEWKVKLEEI